MVLKLFQLFNAAGIERSHFFVDDEPSKIRIEKLLISAQRLDDRFGKNDLELALQALHEQYEALSQFYLIPALHKVFTTEGYKVKDVPNFYPKTHELKKTLHHFFATYLESEIFEGIKNDVYNNEYKAIAKWKPVSQVFPLSFHYQVASILLEKVNAFLNILPQKLYSFPKEFKYVKTVSFYKALEVFSTPELDEAILNILRFYNNNAEYTKGNDFLDSVLVSIAWYKPNDSKFQLLVFSIAEKAGGSYKVAFIAGAIIVGLMLLIVVYYKATYVPPVPRPYEPKNEMEAVFYEQQYKQAAQILSILKYGQSNTVWGDSCFAYARYSSKLSFLQARMAGTAPTEIHTDFKLANGLQISDLAYSTNLVAMDSTVSFVNAMGQPAIVTVFVSRCYYPKNKGYYPCRSKYGVNRVYIDPHDTVKLDYKFDSLYVQTGERFYEAVWPGMNRTPSYLFCPVNANDSLLLRSTFFNKRPYDALSGVFVLNKVNEAYHFTWNGPKNTIIDKRRMVYLNNGQAVLIAVSDER